MKVKLPRSKLTPRRRHAPDTMHCFSHQTVGTLVNIASRHHEVMIYEDQTMRDKRPTQRHDSHELLALHRPIWRHVEPIARQLERLLHRVPT